MRGYMLIGYDDLKSFNHSLSKTVVDGSVCSADAGIFEKLWFTTNTNGVVFIHEYLDKPEVIAEFVKKEGLLVIRADYEYIK